MCDLTVVAHPVHIAGGVRVVREEWHRGRGLLLLLLLLVLLGLLVHAQVNVALRRLVALGGGVI